MKKPLILIILFTISFSMFCQNTSIEKYDFDETKYKYETPDQLATTFLKSLDNFKESEFLELCVSKEAMLYMIGQISMMRQDAQNIDEVVEATEEKFDESIKQYTARAQMIITKIKKQKVKISECIINNINYEVKDLYGLKPNIMFTNLTMYLNYNGEQFQLQLPQLVRIKGKWFIIAPSIYWRDNEEIKWLEKHLGE